MATKGTSSSTFPVFVDTNLETHLLILVSSDDTVADLKGKISTEHILSFPDIGGISVQAMKVKRRGSFYSLSNSMGVERAFEGIKGARFLHIDLVPTTSTEKSQAELTKVIMSESDMQPDKYNLLKTGHDANLLAIKGEDRHRDSIINGLATEKGLIQTSFSSALEGETLSYTHLQKPLGQGLDKRQGCEVREMEELVIEGNAAVEFPLQQNSKEVADHKNKDGRGEDHENTGIGADMGVPVVSKKEKSRKRRNALEIDQLPDGKSEHSNVEKKRSKKENDGSSKEFAKETVMPEYSLGGKHDNSLVSLEGFPSMPSHVDSKLQAPVDAKQKRKKKKHILKNDETPQNELVDSLLNKTDDATQGDQAAEVDHAAELVNNHTDLGNESDAVDLMVESTQKMLETVFLENRVPDKHGTNFVSSDGVLSKQSVIDSLQAPVDAKHKRKKKKHRSKSDVAPENDMVDKSNNASLGKEPSEENRVEELMKKHSELGKESDATDLIKESTPKKHDGHSEELRMMDPLSANPKELTDTPKPSTDSPAQDENFIETSGNNHAQLSKLADVVIADADLANKNAMESGIPSEIGAKSSHRSKRKKGEKDELPNIQSNTHETVNSPRDQVPEEIQNKTSGTHREQLVGSSVLSSPNERKKKHNQKKSEKMELHQESNLQSGTQEAVNLSVDQIIGELSKEISIKHSEAANLQEAVENSTTVQSIVPSNPDDKKSKRNRKKSDKIKLPSGDPIRAESDHSLLDEATKVNPQECFKDTHNKTLGSNLGHPSKDSEVTAADSTVPLNPSDKKSKCSKKKSGKTELRNEEYPKDELVHPLDKGATKENPGGTLNDVSAHHSLANERTNENLEIILGNTNKSSGNVLNAGINLDETVWSTDHANISKLVPTGFDDSSGNHKTGCLSEEKENTIGLGKASERSLETVHVTVHNTSEAENHRQLPKSDSANTNVIKFSDPNLNQSEEVQGLLSVETETNKTNKENTKRRKKLNLSPLDSTINLSKSLVSSEQQVLKKKTQDSDSGKHSLVAPAVDYAKEELKSIKNHEKRDANRIQKSGIHLHDTSSDLGSPVDDRIDKKLKHHGSNTHTQGSLRVEKKSKHPIGKSSKSTGSKLQSLTHKDTDSMVSAGEVSKHNIDDTSVRSRTGGAAVAKYTSSAVANIPSEEDMANLAASSDSTEDDTPIQRKRYRVAVGKVPSKRYGNVSKKSNEGKTLLSASAAIFSDAASGSSEDEFEISNRPAPVRATSDKSSTSSDSYGDLEETQTAYKNSPAGSESTEYRKVDKGTYVVLSSPTKASNVIRGKPLGAILMSSSSYKKAKLTASQSEFDDSESQPFDMVPETQHE